MTDEFVPFIQPDIVETDNEATSKKPRPKPTRLRLTKTAVERAKGPQGTVLWDEELRGFGLLLGSSDRKFFIVQKDVLVDGVRKTRRVKIGPTSAITVEDAREQAQGLIASMWAGQDPKAKPKGPTADQIATLQTVLDRFLEARRDLRPSTAAEYRANIERYLASWLNKPMQDISRDEIERRHEGIQKAVAAKYPRRPTAGFSISNTVFASFRAIWVWWREKVGEEEFPECPVNRALKRQWYPERRKERVLAVDRMPDFYRAVSGLQNRVAQDYLLTLAFTGARAGEIAMLKWDDIDFGDGGTIRIRGETTKSGRPHVLPMVRTVRDLLISRRRLGSTSEFVFESVGANGYIAKGAQYFFTQIAVGTGVRLSAHDLRRGYASVGSTLVGWAVLKRLLGHALSSDVTDGYCVFSTEELRREAQKIDDKLRQLFGIEEKVADNVAVLGR